MNTKLAFLVLISGMIAITGCDSTPSDVAVIDSIPQPASSAEAGAAATSPAAFYFVDHYDAKRDPEKIWPKRLQKPQAKRSECWSKSAAIGVAGAN